jgi:50S ribosome-binding GTPase
VVLNTDNFHSLLLYSIHPLSTVSIAKVFSGSQSQLQAMLLQPRLLPRFLSISAKPRYTPFSPLAAQLTLPLPSPPVLSPVEPDPNPPIQNPIKLPLRKLFVPPETDIDGDATSVQSRILTGSNIVLGPYAHDSQVVNAEFVKSSVRAADCPTDGLPEFALVGRSNVGKSSLLNSLVKRKKLALTSKKPGLPIMKSIFF